MKVPLLIVLLHVTVIQSSRRYFVSPEVIHQQEMDNERAEALPPIVDDVHFQLLAKINSTCLTAQEQEEMEGGHYLAPLAVIMNAIMGEGAIKSIGLAEIRHVAGLAPPGPWTAFLLHSQSNFNDATTIEEFYNLREPRELDLTLDSTRFREPNLRRTIEFLNRRIPEIREVFRRRYESIRPRDAPGQVKRDELDQMVYEYYRVQGSIRKALYKGLGNYRCSSEKEKN